MEVEVIRSSEAPSALLLAPVNVKQLSSSRTRSSSRDDAKSPTVTSRMLRLRGCRWCYKLFDRQRQISRPPPHLSKAP